jgi:branched-chain amino acid transport system ATP-binding protein
MTVVDNLVTAAMALRPVKFSMVRPLSAHRGLYARAQDVLAKVGMQERAGAVLKYLSHGEQRQIEIAMALISNPRVLLLDEPTAGLSPAESTMMTATLRQLDPGITILIIEHDMDVAFAVASRISVLHQGALFTEGTPAEIRADARVQEIYFGAED